MEPWITSPASPTYYDWTRGEYLPITEEVLYELQEKIQEFEEETKRIKIINVLRTEEGLKPLAQPLHPFQGEWA
jgi:hypothetical protein